MLKVMNYDIQEETIQYVKLHDSVQVRKNTKVMVYKQNKHKKPVQTHKLKRANCSAKK